MKKNKQSAMSYEPEADILLYFEILEATKFLRRASTMLDAIHKKELEPAYQ